MYARRACWHQRTTPGSWFYPYTTWIPGAQLRFSGLAAGAFTSSTILLALSYGFLALLTLHKQLSQLVPEDIECWGSGKAHGTWTWAWIRKWVGNWEVLREINHQMEAQEKTTCVLYSVFHCFIYSNLEVCQFLCFEGWGQKKISKCISQSSFRGLAI